MSSRGESASSSSTPGGDSISSRKALILVGLCTFGVFLPSLWNGFVAWDDDKNFLENPSYRGLHAEQLRWMFTHFHLGHYQPLSWVTLGLDYTLGGMNPFVYHLTNVVLHSVSAMLLALLVASLCNRAGAGGDSSTGATARVAQRGILFGSFVALAWAVHPLRVEAVSWITERREVLCGALTLAALSSHARDGQRWLTALLSLAAMLSKATAVLIPVLLLLIDVQRAGGLGSQGWVRVALSSVRRNIAVVALAGACSIAALAAQRETHALVGTTVLPLASRFVLFFYGAAFYVEKSLWPAGLAPLHQGRVGATWQLQSFVQWEALIGAVAVLLALVLGWRWRARFPAWLTLVCAYVAMLAPVGGLGQSGVQIAGERYAYQLGWVLTLGGALLLEPGVRRISGALSSTVAAALLLVLATLSVCQQRIWHDTESLWRRQLEVHPGDGAGSFQLGLYYTKQTPPRFDLAEPLLRAAVARMPEDAESRSALAGVLRDTDRAEEAVKEFSTVLLGHPEHLPSLHQLGRLLWTLGRPTEAIAAFERLATADDRNPEAHRELARARAAAGEPAEAVRSLERGLALGDNQTLLSDLAWLLATHPDAAVRNGPRALEFAERAKAAGPLDARGIVMFAAACAEAGEFERGQREIEAGISRLPSEVAPALRALGEKLGNREPIRASPTFP